MISLIYGGITHHLIGSNLNYCNTVNNYGTIHNEYFIAMAGTKNSKLGFIKGKDSACGDIFGPIASFSIANSLDFVVGGYNTNFEEFEKRNINPVSVGSITPVIGVNYKIPILKKSSYEVNLNNLVSFGIITHAISVDF